MKIVIGVNDLGSALGLCEFVTRFDFPRMELELVHVRSPFIVPPEEILTDPNSLAVLSEGAEAAKIAMQTKLEEIAAQFRNRHVPTTVSVVTGAPGPELLRCADEAAADLLVVGRAEGTPLTRLLLGSVSRAVVIGAKMSVLVVRLPVEQHRGLIHAVFATDHSKYCERCIEHFQELSPRGVGHLTVLNVYPVEDLARLRWALPAAADDVEHYLVDKLKQKTAARAEELSATVPLNDVRVEIGDLRSAIRDTVANTKSELLILGAQGHSLRDRLSMGSVSFHQAMAEPYSVLILRV